jgi:cytochrome c biogenesis protein CcmG/thiol:disulfide interchange protein DsbE
MRRAIPLLIFTIFALIAAVALLARDDSAPPGEQAARPLPALPLVALNRPTEFFDNTAYRGKVVLFNVFASWCLPCLAEMRELEALAEQFPALERHGIVWNDSPKNIRAFLKKHGNPFTMLWRDTTGQSAIALGLRGVPETYLINARGEIIYHIPGPIDRRLREDVLAPIITRALAEAGNAR